ncbi:uncharacterized protein si:dkey-20d21.12 [Erpetoichthys calabaricus]|uniref:uncharacterized protein si:dkey-20d21.12 n=1 Tax=Erpetoichthys calabaricus TaxID=27687 RepID=UPI002234064E|nr:uncharacterized protein si:dkey-20d21.12 [Erpetoichthys calabaricus]XP_051777326.1 uncharacterized protein si:dkey-20d21.12 [Erpetoichthys calabaricus]
MTQEDLSADGFMRISDQAMTEIELHSVESINDLHRLNNNLEPAKTGGKPVRLEDNGGSGPFSKKVHLSLRRPRDVCCAYCGPGLCRYVWVWLTVILAFAALSTIFYFLVRQNESIHALSFAINQRKELVKELSALTKELQELRHNLTADWSLHGT